MAVEADNEGTVLVSVLVYYIVLHLRVECKIYTILLSPVLDRNR